MQYSQELKERMIQKLLLPGGPSAIALSSESGIAQSTLSRWLKDYQIQEASMKESKPSEAKKPEEIFKILSEVEHLTEEEYGAYLREKGLHSSTIEAWRRAFLKGFSEVNKPPGRPKDSPEVKRLKKELKSIQKELSRKEKALAETTALLVLKKKVQALLSGEEEE